MGTFLFGDGSVRTIKCSVELKVLQALSTRDGGEVVDPDRYRDPKEVKAGRTQEDPITAFAARLQAAGLIDDQGLQKMEEQVEQEVEHAVQFAEQSPDPPVEGLFDYMYAPAETSQGGK